MSNAFLPIKTADIKWNHNLPFSNLYNDIYHSLDSGITQSRYVFIDGNDLINRWSALSDNEKYIFSIGETGFGMGLNFLFTWSLWDKYAPPSASLHFISCEKHPLKKEDLDRALSNWPELNYYKQELLKQYPILTPGNHHLAFSNGRVKLTLMLEDAFTSFEQLLICGDSLLESELKTNAIDAWYLDGFAPKYNQSMWTEHLFNVIGMLSKKGTTFATYTAASNVKAGLAECGFAIIKKKGYGKKRHMIYGHFLKPEPYRLKNSSTPWHLKRQYHQERSAIIVGGGLAGCFTAHSLAKRGWNVRVIDAQKEIGQGASANQRAVLFPKLSAFRSPLTEFMLASFLYAHRIYSHILKQENPPLGELNGCLTLPYNTKEQNGQHSLSDWLSVYPELGLLINAQQASDLSGISIATDCLHIPYSGWIDSPALCRYLLNTLCIEAIHDIEMNTLRYEDNEWWINDLHAPVLVLANGHKVNQFAQTQHLPIKPIRGQMTQIYSTKESQPLRLPVCAQGHVVPAVNGVHYLGATYELGSFSAEIKIDDDKDNIKKLANISPIHWSNEAINHWAGVRATTPDYLPLLGPVAKEQEFISLYAGLESNAKRWIPVETPCYPGLYVCSGFGSRGLTTIPLSTEWLAAMVNNEIIGAPRHLLQALSPARFLKRNITRGLYKDS